MIVLKRLIMICFFSVFSIGYYAFADSTSENQTASSHSYPHYQWSFSGPLGNYDLASVQRGYAVYRRACASCHSIQHMTYLDLQGMGLTLEQIADIAAKDQVLDGEDAQGKKLYRPGRVTDHFPVPYINDLAAKAANQGKIPVDFSRFAVTIHGGADYIMAILLGYRDPPAGFHADREGYYYNLYANDQQIAMKPSLSDHLVQYTDGTKATTAQEAKDVTTFLSWIARPHLIERHRIGVRILFYSLFILILVFLVKRKVWSNVR